MGSVLSSIKDPSWWFSAVFVAVIAGVVSGFAKDILEYKFGLFLAWPRQQRQESRARRIAEVQAWSSSEGLVTLAVLQTIYWCLVSIGSAILVDGYLFYLRLKHTDSRADAVPGLSLFTVFALIFMSLGLFQLFSRAFALIGKTNDVMRQLRRRENLPPFGPDLN